MVSGQGSITTETQRHREDRNTFSVPLRLCGSGFFRLRVEERVEQELIGAVRLSPVLRTDPDQRPTGGIRQLWEWHALQPKLGLFHDREADIPYDFDDVLALIAPRPCLIVSPQRDRFATHADAVACVSKAREAWTTRGAAGQLTHLTPDDISRFQKDQHSQLLDWLNVHR